MRALLRCGSSLLFYCIDWCFVDRSYLTTHNSSPMMIRPRSGESASQSFKNISAMKTHSFFCFGIKTFKTSFEHTFYISKFCHRILCPLVHEISVLSAISAIVFQHPSRFLISLFQHHVCCTQWPIDQLEHDHAPILFYFGNDPPTSSLLYSSTRACHTPSLVLSTYVYTVT